ncbi:DNA-directed RNA polymerase [Spartinivicinus ruber]|uniref:DNA-directed RNA polymerase n=1 Tax=Spartinivicinus ruber TaxID=2683272 RepID=UPI0013D1378A|nr:DNA-directed RNA polymerase [Spartinivicinus ruber]
MKTYANLKRISGTEEDQVKLEASMAEAGRDRYRKQVLKAMEKEEESDTTYGRRLVSTKTDDLADAIDTWKEKAAIAAGRQHTALRFFNLLDSRTIAYISLKILLNGITREQKLTKTAKAIGKAVNMEVEMRNLKEEDVRLYRGVLRSADKKSQYHRKVATARFIVSEDGASLHQWTEQECFLVGKVLIELIVENLWLIKVELVARKDSREYVVSPTRKCLDWIRNSNALHNKFAAIYEPMVVQPFPWQDPFTGGYLTNQVTPITLVKTRSKSYLQKLAEQKMPLVYKALNKIQATPWRINLPLLDLLLSLAETDSELGGLPRATDLPLPEKPDDIATNEDAKKEWKMAKADVMKHNIRMDSKRISLAMTLKTAEKYACFEKIYFPYQLDFRGRVYPVTNGSLSPQGADYVKALLQFAEGEKLGTQEAADWLAVHIANLWGVDKVSFDERIEWTKENSDMICRIAENPYDNRQWTEADKPFQAIAAALEWKGYLDNGLEHVSRIAVALDGSCSGLQHLGMALRCEETGAAVNLIPSDKPQDIYQRVIDRVYPVLEAIVGKGWQDLSLQGIEKRAEEKMEEIYNKNKRKYKITKPFVRWKEEAKGEKRKKDGTPMKRAVPEQEAYNIYHEIMSTYAWLSYGYDKEKGCMSRKIAKRNVMTFPYGSKEYGFKEQLLEDIIKPAKLEGRHYGNGIGISAPEWFQLWNRTGYGFMAATQMASLMYDGVVQTVVKAAEGMEWLQEVAKVVVKNGEALTWTTPLGFPVQQNYWKDQSKRVRTSFLGNTRAEFSIKVETANVDKAKQASAVAPNFVHSLDATHLMLVVAKSNKIKNWALVHDSFGTLPSRTGEIFKNIRYAFYELYTEHDVFSQFRDQAEEQALPKDRNKIPPVPFFGSLEPSLILDSQYSFA